MYCSNCGKAIDEKYKFCNNCGTPVMKIERSSESMKIQNSDYENLHKQGLNENEIINYVLEELFNPYSDIDINRGVEVLKEACRLNPKNGYAKATYIQIALLSAHSLWKIGAYEYAYNEYRLILAEREDIIQNNKFSDEFNKIIKDIEVDYAYYECGRAAFLLDDWEEANCYFSRVERNKTPFVVYLSLIVFMHISEKNIKKYIPEIREKVSYLTNIAKSGNDKLSNDEVAEILYILAAYHGSGGKLLYRERIDKVNLNFAMWCIDRLTEVKPELVTQFFENYELDSYQRKLVFK